MPLATPGSQETEARDPVAGGTLVFLLLCMILYTAVHCCTLYDCIELGLESSWGGEGMSSVALAGGSFVCLWPSLPLARHRKAP